MYTPASSVSNVVRNSTSSDSMPHFIPCNNGADAYFNKETRFGGKL
jgi:hypothetical protein